MYIFTDVLYLCLRLLILCCYRFYSYQFTTRIFRPYTHISLTCNLDSSYLLSTHGTNIYFLQAATSAINLRNNYSVLFYITTWHCNMHMLGFILSFLISICSLMMALFTSRNVWLIIRIIFNWAEVSYCNQIYIGMNYIKSIFFITQSMYGDPKRK
jgi:hypothetical protein